MRRKYNVCLLISLLLVLFYSCSNRHYNQQPDLYRNVQGFVNGKHRYGFGDRFDHVIIDYKYTNARQFNEGVAAVANEQNKWGFINEQDSVVIPFEYDYAGSFGDYGFDGLAIVKNMEEWYLNPHMTNGMMGFIDHNGVLATPMKYNMFGHSRELGLFRVTDQRGRYGWLDKAAKEIIPCEHDSIIQVSNNLFVLTKNGQVVTYNNKGEILVDF